jgi:hypothetical protein
MYTSLAMLFRSYAGKIWPSFHTLEAAEAGIPKEVVYSHESEVLIMPTLQTSLCEMLNIELPIIQAPRAGGHQQ